MSAPAPAPRDPTVEAAGPSPTVPLVLFGVLAIAAAVAAVLSLGATAADLRRQRHGELESVAALKVEELERWRDERLSDAEFVTAGLLPGAGARGGNAATVARIVGWFERLGDAGDYTAVALASADGRIDPSTPMASELPDLELAPAIQVALRERRVVDTGVHRLGITGALHLDVVAPVVAPDGSVSGAVILRVDPYRYLFRLLQSWPGPSKTAETLLVWRDGDRVRFANELRHWDDDPLALSVPIGRSEDPAARAAAGEVGAAEGTDYRGRRVLAAMRKVPDTPWALVVKVDEQEALEPLRERAVWIAIAALALVAASGAGATLWWRRQRASFDRLRLRAEVEHAALQQRLEWLTRYANDMVLLSDGETIVDSNDRAALALGRAPGELVGTRVRDLRDPETLGDLDERIRDQREKGSGRFETRFRRADGSTFPVEVSVRLMELGGKPHHLAIVRDVTERKRVEDALRASEEKFRAAFEQAGLGIALVGRDGRIVDTNRSFREILGSGHEDARGREIWELVQPDEAGAARESVEALLEGRRESVRAARRFRRADGSLVETTVRARSIRGRRGELQYVIAVVEDVSERKRLEAQLLLADRMASVGTLAAGVAHEINNPLSFIVANVDYALDELRREGGTAELVRALDDARRGGVRVKEIVRDLKTFSRPQGGDRDALDVREVLRSAVSLAQGEIRLRARLELELGDVPPVLGSEHRLGQVFLNLLVNAAQAIPEGHADANVIRACTRTAASGAVEIEISDTGSGIPPAILDRIFDPFFTTKPVGVGTGLGLAICHGIVTDLGGEIRVRTAVGRGTAFSLTLPAASSPVAARPARPTPPPSTPAGRILVVDDEPLVARAVLRVLSPPNDVVTETSARAALARVERGERFDLVVCDLMMPEMTGMELHAVLATLRPEVAGRMVFLTGGAFTAAAREFLERVPNARIEKPVDAATLRGVVAERLRSA